MVTEEESDTFGDIRDLDWTYAIAPLFKEYLHSARTFQCSQWKTMEEAQHVLTYNQDMCSLPGFLLLKLKPVSILKHIMPPINDFTVYTEF